MLLAIDVGNTNVSFGLFNKQGVNISVWSLDTYLINNLDVIISSIDKNFKGKLDIICIGSVVPAVTNILRDISIRYYSTSEIIFAGDPDVDWGLKINIDLKTEVGNDILLNGIAGYDKYKQAMIIIDFGTATTLDIFDGCGNFTGTIICSGVNLSIDALYNSTALLPRIDIKNNVPLIGKDTVSSIQSGIYWGYLSMIEGLVNKIKKELKFSGIIIITGGLASIFKSGFTFKHVIEDNLTLIGLFLLSERNSKL